MDEKAEAERSGINDQDRNDYSASSTAALPKLDGRVILDNYIHSRCSIMTITSCK